jgi:hypothetical protein
MMLSVAAICPAVRTRPFGRFPVFFLKSINFMNLEPLGLLLVAAIVVVGMLSTVMQAAWLLPVGVLLVVGCWLTIIAVDMVRIRRQRNNRPVPK